MAASRLLVDDSRTLDEQRRVLLPPTIDGRNAALVELNLTAGAGAAEVAGRFLDPLSGLPGSMTGRASPVKSLVLVQGAFSHFAFAQPIPIDTTRSGALVGYRNRVDGPLIATFTSADRAVGWWYPMASALKHEDSQSASDLDYRWGGMGHDGYQQNGITTAVLAQPRHAYDFAAGTFCRLDSNAVIKADQSPISGAHSDIQHPEVAWAAISAAGLG